MCLPCVRSDIRVFASSFRPLIQRAASAGRSTGIKTAGPLARPIQRPNWKRVQIDRRDESFTRSADQSEVCLMSDLPFLVFDVNETLLDLETMAPTFERIFGEHARRRSRRMESGAHPPHRKRCAGSRPATTNHRRRSRRRSRSECRERIAVAARPRAKGAPKGEPP